MNNTEISKMKIGEKIIRLSNGLGTLANVDVAKKAVIKGLAKFGLMILQDGQSYKVEDGFVVVDVQYKIINANNTEEYMTVSSIANGNTIVEAQTRAYTEMLLATFGVIVDNVEVNTVNTVEEAVSKVEEVEESKYVYNKPKENKYAYNKSNYNSKKSSYNSNEDIKFDENGFPIEPYGKMYADMDSKFAQMLSKDIGSHLIGASNGKKVAYGRLKSMYAKMRDIKWSKKETMSILCNFMNIVYDYEMTTEQFNIISDYLEYKEKELKK